jgi:CheY-like chemotaxis protein/HPt (histidine-containing phosphotransfer) domain-containing protein
MGPGVRILVAEDNPVNQKVTLRQLKRLGYQADCVANGIEAVDALRRVAYDLVFMDCQMPEMDGYDATREIRRREGSQRRTTIVALTGNVQEGNRERCTAAGMDDYLSKPVGDAEMKSLLERWLEPLDQSVLDGLRAMGDDDADFVREVADLYLEDSTLRVRAIEAALAAGNGAAMAEAAHALKSSSGHIGAMRVSSLSAKLEQIGREEGLGDAAAVVDELKRECRLAEGRLRDLIAR